MNWRAQIATDIVNAVYGQTKAIVIGTGPRPMMQGYVDRMNEQVIAEGGRIYLAKDALTRPEHFRAMEARLDRFLAVRRTWDPEGRIRSAQSVRLFGW